MYHSKPQRGGELRDKSNKSNVPQSGVPAKCYTNLCAPKTATKKHKWTERCCNSEKNRKSSVNPLPPTGCAGFDLVAREPGFKNLRNRSLCAKNMVTWGWSIGQNSRQLIKPLKSGFRSDPTKPNRHSKLITQSCARTTTLPENEISNVLLLPLFKTPNAV